MFASGSPSPSRARVAPRVLAAALALASVLSPWGRASGQQPPDAEAEPVFRFPGGGAVTAGPVIAGSRVWALSDSRTLYTLSVEGVASGKRVLASRKAAYIACDPYGRAALSDGPDGLVLVNKAGQDSWRIRLPAAPAVPPRFAADGRLYVAFDAGLAAYAPNGRRLWYVSLSSRPSVPLELGPGGGPLLGLAEGKVVLHGPDGDELAAVSVPSAPRALAANRAGCVVAFDAGALVLGPELQSLGSGPEGGVGPARLGSPPIAAAASSEAYYVLCADGSLIALGADGGERWRTLAALEGRGASLAAFEERVVVLSPASASSYGLDGSFYRRLRIKGGASLPAVAANGAVFVGGADWILYAYRFERALTSAPLPAPPALDLASVDAEALNEALWSPRPYDDDSALKRLADIEKKLKTGTIGAEASGAARYAAAVALGRMGAPFGSGALAPRPTPLGALPRARACELLGDLGLAGAVPVLVEVFEGDPDPAVRAAAALAVAAIGLDPEGKALGAFAAAAARRLDERTAFAVIGAIEGLYRASGALDERAGVLALLRLSGGDYPADIRARARSALSRVSRH